MKILITAPFSESNINLLKQKAEVIYQNWQTSGGPELNSKSLIKRLNDEKIDILVSEADEIDSDVINNTKLVLIASTRGTPVNVDKNSASKQKIPIIFAPHRNADAVADLTVMMMLMQVRKFVSLERLLTSGSFDFSDLDEEEFGNFFNKYQGRELGNLTIGIIGFGAIGSRVARRLFFGFGSSIIYYDPYILPTDPNVKSVKARQVSLEELLSTADLITLHVPPIPETDGLIGEKEFNMMKPTAHFFNLARSFSIDEDALFKALENNKIAGAGLDVFDTEPVDSDNRFLKFNNVIVTPHIGGNTLDVINHQSSIITNDILAFLDNKKPKNVWNHEIYQK